MTPHSNALKATRLARKLTQAELGARLGVPARTVRALESGRYDPPVTLACRIAEILDQPVEALFHA